MTDAIRNPEHLKIEGPAAVVAASRRSRAARIAAAIAAVVGAALIALVAGFIGFAQGIVNARPPADAHADGIVVLTGGTARIDGALQLLVEGRGQRLLISGVNPSVTRAALGQTLTNEQRAVLNCCVDLDHEAQNTIGNAVETRQWADSLGYTSLIVVTSGYHMPRSMAELAEAMPGRRLIAFPVSNAELHLGDWWRARDAFALLVREYGKYLGAEARLIVGRVLPGAGGVSEPADD